MRKFGCFYVMVCVLTFSMQSQSIPVTGNGYHYYGPNSSWGEYLQVGGNGKATSHASVTATNGNLHLDSKVDYQIYLNQYGKGTPI